MGSRGRAYQLHRPISSVNLEDAIRTPNPNDKRADVCRATLKPGSQATDGSTSSHCMPASRPSTFLNTFNLLDFIHQGARMLGTWPHCSSFRSPSPSPMLSPNSSQASIPGVQSSATPRAWASLTGSGSMSSGPISSDVPTSAGPCTNFAIPCSHIAANAARTWTCGSIRRTCEANLAKRVPTLQDAAAKPVSSLSNGCGSALALISCLDMQRRLLDLPDRPTSEASKQTSGPAPETCRMPKQSVPNLFPLKTLHDATGRRR